MLRAKTKLQVQKKKSLASDQDTLEKGQAYVKCDPDLLEAMS